MRFPNATVVLFGCGFGLMVAFAQASLAPRAAAAAEPVNACGCYRDDQGTCKCTRKSKCGCPEECEPMGCEAKREREAEKAADAALKQIAERERSSKKAAESQNAKKAAQAKAAKRDKTAEKADKAAEKAMKAAMRAADEANPTPPTPRPR